jgi:hypothetical protein
LKTQRFDLSEQTGYQSKSKPRGEFAMAFKDRDALYYPYIHIRDVDWLKHTLLIFPHVVRMVPKDFNPSEDPETAEFSQYIGTRAQPLLRQADLQTAKVIAAQEKLLKQLDTRINQDPNILQRFGREATEFSKEQSDLGFQIHLNKVCPSFFKFLDDHDLTWIPAIPDGHMYREVHPRLGEAIMSTLAIACAKDEGLDIVTDQNQRQLDRCLATKSADSVFDAWLTREEGHIQNSAADGGRLLEIIVYQHCNAEKLNAKNLAALSQEREPLAKLHDDLERLASSIPDDIENDSTLKERLEDTAQTALKRWKHNRANLSSLLKEMVGADGTKEVGDILQDLVTKVTTPETAGSALAVGAHVGLKSGFSLGALAGVGIGVVVHTLASLQRVKQRAKRSPYRYLTMLERAGVAFTIGKTA